MNRQPMTPSETAQAFEALIGAAATIYVLWRWHLSESDRHAVIERGRGIIEAMHPEIREIEPAPGEITAVVDRAREITREES